MNKKIFTFIAAAGIGLFTAQAQTVATFMGIAGSTTEPSPIGGIPKAQAVFFAPWGMSFDNVGNFWVTESDNSFASPAVEGNRLRMLYNINDNVYFSAGDNGRASGYYNYPLSPTSRFDAPCGLALDNAGNIYIADYGNHAIRKIDAFTALSAKQFASTFAGSKPDLNFHGVSGNVDGDSINARFNHPQDIVFDGTGAFYVADTDNNKIRKITSSGVVTTLAGDAGGASGDVPSDNSSVSLSAARFNAPAGLAIANNKLYVADQYNQKIRVIDLITNMVSTLAGSGTFGTTDGAALSATFKYAMDVAVDASGNVYVCEGMQASIIRKISGGQVSTFAGTDGQLGTTDGMGAAAKFNDPRSLYYDPFSTKLYVADYGNGTIRTITTVTGAAPVAAIGGPSSCKTNTTYTFTDQSTNAPTSRTWSVQPNSYDIMPPTTASSASVDIQFTADGNYTVTLQVQNAIGGDIATKQVTASATGINSVHKLPVVIYPNPARENFTVKSPGSKNATVSLTDITGRVVITQTGEGEILFSTMGIEKGIYLVRVESEGRTATQKLAIQ